MLSERTIGIAEKYWADYLGCAAADFRRPAHLVIPHGRELADYRGIFAFFRDAAPVISVPADLRDSFTTFFAREFADNVKSPAHLAEVVRSLKGTIIGPAFIGYADETSLQRSLSDVRLLDASDESSVNELIASCPSVDWEHGGSLVGDQPTAGVFVDGRLAALAGYEIWGGSIAHIAVITNPEFRGRGFGRSVVSTIAQHALTAGLLPQYRTLQSNSPSMRIASTLGFESFGLSVVVRLPQ